MRYQRSLHRGMSTKAREPRNLLLFVPLIVSHNIAAPALSAQSVLAFVAFCLCASSVYILNDLLDLAYDQRHPRKRNRPFASGTVSVYHRLVLAPLLLAASNAFATFLPVEFALLLAVYYATTLAYFSKLKQIVLIDVMVLAGLYTLRITSGAATISIRPSFWLLTFFMFIFFKPCNGQTLFRVVLLEKPPATKNKRSWLSGG